MICKETVALNMEKLYQKKLNCQYDARYFVNPRRNHASALAGKS